MLTTSLFETDLSESLSFYGKGANLDAGLLGPRQLVLSLGESDFQVCLLLGTLLLPLVVLRHIALGLGNFVHQSLLLLAPPSTTKLYWARNDILYFAICILYLYFVFVFVFVYFLPYLFFFHFAYAKFSQLNNNVGMGQTISVMN